jgi:hypothetical protein
VRRLSGFRRATGASLFNPISMRSPVVTDP